MLPHEPPRLPQLGFLYVPPYRIQGISIAGEESVVQIPELDLCFDIGRCPRPAVASAYVALTHGHMDHSAGLAYYFSQRHFQGMSPGTIVCHRAIERAINNIMSAWVDLEAQRTPYNLIGLDHDGEVEIKNQIFLRGFETVHTVPSLGFVVVERRTKLKVELTGLPQEKLVELKRAGQEITRTIEIPLVCYTGDTMWGPHFDRPDVLESKILITECTFFEADHESRASIGRHLHLKHVAELVSRSKADAIVLTHLSRRTHMEDVRRHVAAMIRPEDRHRVFLLMDNKTNRLRYQQQAQATTEQTPSN